MSCCRRDSDVDGELFLSLGVSNSETQQGLESRRRWSQHKHKPWELSEHACTITQRIYTEDLAHTVHPYTLTAGKQIRKVHTVSWRVLRLQSLSVLGIKAGIFHCLVLLVEDCIEAFVPCPGGGRN